MRHRVEVITGTERRRRWSEDEKARLVAETLEPGAIIAPVARRHGVAESCLYAWRRQLVDTVAGGRPRADAPPLLIPVTLDAPPPPEPEPPPASPPPRALITFPDGTRLEIGADYPAPALTALITAVRGQR